MTDHDQDDLLRARLHASDPAASLPPADPERVARLLEDVMSTELTTENRETGTHDRGPLTWLVAAAAAVIIAGVGLFAVLNHDEDPARAADGRRHDAHRADGHGAVRAGRRRRTSAKCMVPNAEVLAQQSVAFDGTVTAAGRRRRHARRPPPGTPASRPTWSRCRRRRPSWRSLLLAVSFEEGGRYLVSATDGQVTLCGFSAPYSAELAALYDAGLPWVTVDGLLLAAGRGLADGHAQGAGRPTDWLVRGGRVRWPTAAAPR